MSPKQITGKRCYSDILFCVQTYSLIALLICLLYSFQARVTIHDENDTPPRFSKSFYEVNVDENVHTGFIVTTLPVYDDDELGGLSLTIEEPADSKLKITADSKYCETL